MRRIVILEPLVIRVIYLPFMDNRTSSCRLFISGSSKSTETRHDLTSSTNGLNSAKFTIISIALSLRDRSLQPPQLEI